MSLSILQWNVLYKEDIENTVKFLKEINPDIACLQELTKNYSDQHPDTLKYIADCLGYFYYESEPMVHYDVDWKQFNGIFSRFPLNKTKSIWINEPRLGGSYKDEYRSYIEATVNVDNRDLVIGTTHMSYADWFRISKFKKEESDKLVNIIKNRHNIILTGDFNAPPKSYTIKELNKILKNAGPNLDQKTFATKPFRNNNFNVDDLSWRIDNIFVGSAIKIISSHILKTEFSDHLPILISIE